MKECKHYWVSGRVQGVFFRASARAQGTRLGLVGWVKNLSDGRVEAVACGEALDLRQFETWLRVGPPGASVAGLAIEVAVAQELNEFEIR